jgi:hypothetical protein
VTGLNGAATTWLSSVRASAAIVTAVAARSDSKDSLLKQLKLDFLKLLAERDPCPTATEFMNSFYESGNPEAYIEVSANLAVFSTLRDNFVTHTRTTRKEKPMRESLQEFCETHPLPEHISSATFVTTQSGFRALVEAISKFFVLRRSEKRRTVWFYGAPNCGKTMMTKLLAQIFLTQSMQLLESKYTLVSNEPPFATQLVLLDEASMSLFCPANLDNTKRFFEGRGFPQRAMNQTPRITYHDACVFLATNALPDLAKEDHPGHAAHWPAIRVRTAFIHMTTSHADTSKFPFDATVLAHAILETIAQSEPPLTQCSQPEEEKHDTQRPPPVPVFASEDPALTELLGEFSPTPVAVG